MRGRGEVVRRIGGVRRGVLPRTQRPPGGALGRALAGALAGALVGALALFAGPPTLEAQVVLPGSPQVERQEALLPAIGVFEVDAELRRRLGLFPEIAGFRVARLFLLEAGGMVLEVEWMEGGVLRRDRRPLSQGALEALRQSLEDQVAQAGWGAAGTREGRGGLILGHTALGLGYHGWAVPVALDLDSSRAQVAAYLLTAGASFYLPWRLTRDRPVTAAHRSLSLYGGTRGIVAGVFLADLLLLDPDDPGRDEGRVRLGGGALGGLAGGTVGYLAADWLGGRSPGGVLSLGDAELRGAFGDGGFLAGAALAYLSGPYRTEVVEVTDGEFTWDEERLRSRRGGHAMVLAGHGAGLALGGWLAGRRDYSPGDVSVLRSAAVLGVQGGATLARLGGADDGVPYVAGMLAGGVAGVVAGDRWAGPRGLDRGDGLLVNAGHLAGGATALGLTYLVVDQVDGNETAMLLSSTLGGVLGAGLVWRAVGGTEMPRRASRSEADMRTMTRVRVSFHPEGILAGVVPQGNPRRDATARPTPGPTPGPPPPTWVSIRF